MWNYEKRLLYPVKVTAPNPAAAKLICRLLSGSDGELTSAMRCLCQRHSMPYDEGKAVLTDIGTSGELTVCPSKSAILEAFETA